MAAHSNGQAITFYPCGAYLSSFFFFFSRLISAVGNWMSTILPHMICNLKCMLHAARWKYRTQKLCKTIAIGAPSHNFFGLYLRNEGVHRHGTNVKQQYLLHMSSQYAEHRPSNGWDLLASLGHPQQISTGFAYWLGYCADVTQRTSTKLCKMFGSLLRWYTIYTLLGPLAP